MADRSVRVILRAEIAEYKRAMAEATAATKKVGDQTSKTADESTKAQERQTQSTKKTTQATEEQAQKTASASARMVQSAQKNEEAWTKAGAALTGFGVLASAALVGSVNAAVQWESAWAGVTKTIDGTPEQLDAVEQGLRDLARTLPATHTDIAAVAEAAGQLGIAAGDVVGFTKVMIDLGETTNLTADEAATSLAQLMNIMGTAPSQVDRLGATLVALGNAGASTEKDILEMSQRIAGAGKLVGASEGEVLALASALSSMGINAELGGGVASRILQDIYSRVKTGGRELEEFAQVAGVSAQEFADAFENDPIRALALFAGGLNGVEASGGNVIQTLADLGIKSSEEQRVLLQLKANTELLTDSLDLQAEAWSSNTALIDEANKRYDTTEAKLQIARNTINDAAISVGESLTPALATGAEKIADFASWFAQLPEPVTGAAGALAGVAAVTGLAGGAFLLAFPRVIETVKAFRQLQTISPGLAGGLGKVASIGSRVGLALVAAQVAAGAISGSLDDGRDTVTEYTAALLDLENQTKQSGSVVEDLGKAFDFARSNTTDDLGDMVTRLVGLPTTVDQVRSRFDLLGKSLAGLYESDPDLAAERFQAILAETGGTTDELLDLMPAYRDALQEVENQQALNEAGARLSTQTYAEFMGVTEELTEAQQAFVDAVSDSANRFVDPVNAMQSVIAKNQEFAQSTADATESATDSWEDYYDGSTVALNDWIAELEANFQAQQEWETNMILLSGRVSDGVLDQLARMGPEGAPLVAQLVDASDDEIARLEGVLGTGAANGVNAFANTLLISGPVIAAAGAQLGAGAAAEIAAALAAGTTTVEEVIRQYGLRIEGYSPTVTLNVDTARANANILGFNQALGAIPSSKSVGINVTVRTSYAGTPLSGGQTMTMQVRNRGGIIGLASGGVVPGNPPPDPRIDNMLAMGPSGLIALRSGEYVSTQESTRKNRAALAAGNAGATLTVVPGMASGGAVGTARQAYAGLSAARPVVVVEQVVVRDVDGALIGRMRTEAGAVVAGRVTPIDEGRAAW